MSLYYESPVEKYRKKHKKCIFCKYLKINYIEGFYRESCYKCTAKEKEILFTRRRRHCKIYNPKEFKE